MRTDENNNQCPSTLGEYRYMCAAIGGESCKAVTFLDERMTKNPHGRDEEVIQSDAQMRILLMPMLMQ